MSKTAIIAIGIMVAMAASVVIAQKRKPQAPDKALAGVIYVNVTVEDIAFTALPRDLASTLIAANAGKILDYKTLEKMREYQQLADQNPEILLALAWLHADIVNRGTYIDDLRTDFDIGNGFYNRYVADYGPDYAEGLLPVAEKLDHVQAKLEWFEANPL